MNLTFEGKAVRVVGSAGRPEWVASDVCEVLGIKNHRDALSDLGDYQRGVVTTDTPGGKQEMLTVTEPGLYALVFKSRKPEAERFQRWVFEVVLPEIRRSGGFGRKDADRDPLLQLEIAQEYMGFLEKQIAGVKGVLEGAWSQDIQPALGLLDVAEDQVGIASRFVKNAKESISRRNGVV